MRSQWSKPQSNLVNQYLVSTVVDRMEVINLAGLEVMALQEYFNHRKTTLIADRSDVCQAGATLL